MAGGVWGGIVLLVTSCSDFLFCLTSSFRIHLAWYPPCTKLHTSPLPSVLQTNAVLRGLQVTRSTYITTQHSKWLEKCMLNILFLWALSVIRNFSFTDFSPPPQSFIWLHRFYKLLNSQSELPLSSVSTFFISRDSPKLSSEFTNLLMSMYIPINGI